jgi:hypothetical protein
MQMGLQKHLQYISIISSSFCTLQQQDGWFLLAHIEIKHLVRQIM